MTHVLLIRHGETEWNAAGRVQGHSESPLSERGRTQAAALAARLALAPLHAIYASDLGRALDTAAPIAAAHGLPVHSLVNLRERHYGDWEGLTLTDLETDYPADWHRYHKLREFDFPVPGAETWPEVKARVVSTLHEILTNHTGREETVALVGHGGSLRMAVLDALQAPLATLLRVRLDNASLSRLDYPTLEDGRVIFLNDTSHWPEAHS